MVVSWDDAPGVVITEDGSIHMVNENELRGWLRGLSGEDFLLLLSPEAREFLDGN